MARDLLLSLTHACLFPFEQFIDQQMVQLQNSISKCLHHHTLSNMFFNKIYEAHCARTLSCSGPRASTWFIVRPIYLTFWLSSPIFPTTFCMRLWLPHPSITCILWCMFTRPINPMGIHLLRCIHGNKCTKTHDVVCDTFATIARNVGFHMGWK